MKDNRKSKRRLKELLFTLKVQDNYLQRFGPSESVKMSRRTTMRRVNSLAKFLGVEVKDYKIVQL